MARVRSLSRGHQNVALHSSSVDCFHQVVTGPGNTVVLHLSTFGSDDRHSAPKSSQSLQIDEDIASGLLRVLSVTFPSLFTTPTFHDSKAAAPL
jgi:hypothetical protein